MRRRRRRHRHRPVRLRGRPVRGRRHLRLVRRQPGSGRPTRRPPRAAGIGVHEHLTALAAEQPIGAHGLVALDWWSGNRSVLVDHDLSGLRRRTHPHHPARGRLPRAAGVDGLRGAGHRRDVRGIRRAGDRVHRDRRPAEERPPHADLRRRARHAAVGRHVDPGPGARLGAARRGRRGRLPRRADRREGHGSPPAGGVHPRSPRTSRPTTGCTRSTASCTTTSAAARAARCAPSRRSVGRPTRDRHDPDVGWPCVRRSTALRAEVAALHGELARYGLVIWTAGNVSARVPGRGPHGHQALGCLLRRPRRRRHRRHRPRTATCVEGDRGPVLGHRRPRLRLPAHAPGRRGRAHALHLRDRLGRPPRADPLRAHHGRRRVRRRDPGRPVRADRRRLDRPRHRRDPAGLTQPRAC